MAIFACDGRQERDELRKSLLLVIGSDVDKIRGRFWRPIVVHMKGCNGEKSMEQKRVLECDLRNYSLPDLQMLWVV